MAGRAGEGRAHGFWVDALAVHGAVATLALHALLQVDGLAVVIEHAAEEALLWRDTVVSAGLLVRVDGLKPRPRLWSTTLRGKRP